MRWIALFDDTPAMAPIRRAHERAHFDYLRKHQTEILIAGGLREAPGGSFSGGLWILEVPSKQRAIELIEADPYHVHGRRPYKLLVWGKALPDIHVLL